jgi:Flp pilus assembly protein TadD
MRVPSLIALCLWCLTAACSSMDADSAKGEDNYEFTVRQADDARRNRDFRSAIFLYQRALQIDAGGTSAKVGLGQVFLAVGANEEAAAQFRDALTARASNEAAMVGLASALIGMGQPALAIEQLRTASESRANTPGVFNATGVALDMLGQHAEAQASYRRGIELFPADVALRSNLGLSLAIAGQPDEAIAVLSPLMGLPSVDGRVRQNLALSYVMAGNVEKALELSRRDLDEQSAQRQLSYFIYLKGLPVDLRSLEMRRNPNFFPQATREP